MRTTSAGRTRRFLNWAVLPSGVIGGALLAISPAHGGLIINDVYELSWANAPAGASTDVAAITQELQGLFTNNVTITIQFGWGDVAADVNHPNGIAVAGGGAAYFPQLYTATPDQYTLAQTKTLITNHAAAHPENGPINIAKNNLPAAYANPGGRTTFFVSDAEYKALTGNAQNNDTIDGYVGFGSTDPWQYGATAGGVNTEFFRGALEHEITHAMGRFDSAYQNATLGGNPPYLTPVDFYKYTGTNPDPTRTVTKFSLDAGATNPGGFTFNASSDTSDWNASSADSFNFQLSNSQTMSASDIMEMNALGWDPVPEPGSLTLLGAGLTALAARRRRTR